MYWLHWTQWRRAVLSYSGDVKWWFELYQWGEHFIYFYFKERLILMNDDNEVVRIIVDKDWSKLSTRKPKSDWNWAIFGSYLVLF